MTQAEFDAADNAKLDATVIKLDRRKQVATGDARNSEMLTEDSGAREFVARHSGKFLYCHDQGSWFAWSGSHWKEDRTGLVFDIARNLARDLSDTEQPRMQAIARKTGFAAGIERFSRHDRAFAVTA